MKRIAVIGGGPSGIVTAKVLAQEPANFSIDLFEMQEKLGGLWNYNRENKFKNRPQVPNTTPEYEEIILEKSDVNNGYVSPMYAHLETNIVRDIMKYGDMPFPESDQLFPSRQDVADYLQSYAKTIDKKVVTHLNTEVKAIEKKNGVWFVTALDLKSGIQSIREYDVVVVAHGHFQVPYIPDIKGLATWNEKYSDSVSHAKFYDRSGDYRGKKVVIVGNSASGLDLAIQLSSVADTVYLSCRNPDGSSRYKSPVIQQIAEIRQFDADSKSLVTNDGTIITDVDNVIFCTGYLYTLPFLKTYRSDIETKTGFKFDNLYRDIFYIEDPSLIFIGLLTQVIPMPFSEQQAVYVARVLSDRLRLPNREDMISWYKQRSAGISDDRDFFNMKDLKDVSRIRELWNIVDTVKDGLGGHVSVYWDDTYKELRRETPLVKGERVSDILRHASELRERGQEFSLLR